MTQRIDLIGKTISGIVAVPESDDGRLKIWMLQFSDGTHVEFVSPGARRALGRLAKGRGRRRGRPDSEPQLAAWARAGCPQNVWITLWARPLSHRPRTPGSELLNF